MKILKKGFTLVELVIVIAVIAILTAVLIPTFSGVIKNAQMSACLQEGMNEFKAAHAKDLSDGHLDKTEVMKINTEGWSIGYYVLEVSEGKLEARFRKSYKDDKYFVTFDGKEWNVSDEGEYIGGIIDITQEDGGIDITDDGEFTYEGVTYQISEEEGSKFITVMEFPNDETTIIEIPAYIQISSEELVPVTTISSYSTFENEKITEIKLPSTIIEIEEEAFAGCYGLEKINIPAKVTEIKAYAFYYCESLKSVVIPDYVTTIGDSAFEGCTNLEKVSLPNKLVEIGERAFYSCPLSEELTIPASVNTIGSYAFAPYEEGTYTRTNNIKRVNILGDIELLGDHAFYGCNVLDSVIAEGHINEIGASAFELCFLLSTVNIKGEIQTIGARAFYQCGFKSITLPDTITTMGTSVFQYCSKLETINIPGNENLTAIGGWTFNGCTSLKEIYIPKNIQSIGPSAFAGVDDTTYMALDKIIMPQGITLGENVFQYCKDGLQIEYYPLT